MVQYIPRLNATLALSFALFVGACAKTDNNTAAADSALNKDIQLANRDTAAPVGSVIENVPSRIRASGLWK